MTKFEMANELVIGLNENGFEALINNEHQEYAPFIEATKNGVSCEIVYIHEMDFTKRFGLNEYVESMQKETEDKASKPKLTEEEYLTSLFN